jgi:hypothetical protein
VYTLCHAVHVLSLPSRDFDRVGSCAWTLSLDCLRTARVVTRRLMDLVPAAALCMPLGHSGIQAALRRVGHFSV